MSGHSKWATTKHRKAAQDAKRSALFSKLARNITVAAKEGGDPNPDNNASLAAAIEKAKGYSMPKDKIKTAIDKAFGSGKDAANYETVVYEGYGPAGVAVLCEALTDNRNRTAADVNAGADNQAVVQNVIDQAIEKFGRIDVLVNNAQASASGVTLADHTTDQFDLAIYSGLYATFYYMQACYPYLKETKGSVINFASGAGLFGNFGQCAYAAAKEGIRGLTRVAATEWGPDGINVNVVCPLAWTAALENFQEAYPDAFTANVHMPPMGHYGNVETEIGRVVVQLASPDFKFMSGETLTLEGGMGQRP